MKVKAAGYMVLVSLAVLGLCLPQTLWAAAENVDQQPTIADVALSDGGVVIGQVVQSDTYRPEGGNRNTGTLWSSVSKLERGSLV